MTDPIDDFRFATLNGERIKGWIIRERGEPRYFQIQGKFGFCCDYKEVSDLRTMADEL